jgi:signal recognition particle subunit SRP68
MFGNFLSEQERDWSRALAKFMRARKAFEQLARVGGSDQAEFCRERIEQLEPNLRYCTYKRGNSTGVDEGSLDAEDLAALKGESGADDEKFKGMLSLDGGKPLSSEAPTSLMWRGKEIALRNKDARACVATAANQLAKLESPLTMSADRGLAIYDKAFMAYNDASQHLRDEMATASSAQGGSDSMTRVMEIKLSYRALSVLLLEKTIERNKFLVASASAKLAGDIKLEKGEKAARPEDLVHLYNTLLQNYEELAESGPEVLRGIEGADKVEKSVRMDCMLEQALLQGQRAAALAAVHLGAGSHSEAAVLYARAAEHAAKVQDHAPKSSEIAAAAQKIQSDARKARCIALADGTIARVAEQKRLQSGLNSVSIQEGVSAGGMEAQHLLDHLDEYKSAVLGKGASKVHIMPVPPKFTPIAVNPIVLDLAGDEIVYPELEERMSVKKTSTLRNLFSFGKR